MKRNSISGVWAAAALLFFLAGRPQPAAADVLTETRVENPSDTLPRPDLSARIPDPVFRAWVLNRFDTDGDRQLSPDEAAAVTHISLTRYRDPESGERITSLEGVQLFPGLTALYCAENDLTALDVTGCRALAELDCSGNALSELPLDSCPALARLACHDNRLTALDLSGCAALEVLLCRRNDLTALPLDSCKSLVRLDCSSNRLTALSPDSCRSLSELLCYDNRLTSLDLAGCHNLTRLMCYDNRLTRLDLTGCTSLESLACSRNRLTTLDLDDSPYLSRLICSSNRLTRLDLSRTSIGDDDERRSLWCSDNPLEILVLPPDSDIPGVTDERSADCIDPSTRIEWAD